MDTDLHKLRIDKSQKARRNTRPVWPWVLLLLLLGGGAAGYWEWNRRNAVIEVKTIRVHVPEGAMLENDLVMLNATGYIMAAHRIELASKVVGRVAWVGVEMGDKAKEGQVLVRLEDDEYKARLARETGQLNAAKAKLAELKAGSRVQEIAQFAAQLEMNRAEAESAKRNFDRMAAMRNSSAYTQQELDNAEALMKSKQAQTEAMRQQYEMMKAGPREEQIAAQEATVSQLEAEWSQAKLDLDNTIIRAPMSATILERNVEVGEFVTTGFVGDRGAKGFVVSIADLNDLLVELDISQNDFAKVSMAQPCWITTDAYPDRKYDGRVELISPVANRQKATIQVRVKVLAPDAFLKPDMNATVSFLSQTKLAATRSATTTATERAVIRIPEAAVQDGGVLLLLGGKAVRREVTTGPAANGEIEIRKGLSGGESVIIESSRLLKGGEAIREFKSSR